MARATYRATVAGAVFVFIRIWRPPSYSTLGPTGPRAESSRWSNHDHIELRSQFLVGQVKFSQREDPALFNEAGETLPRERFRAGIIVAVPPAHI